jgi:hypothetical protein
MIDEQRTSCCGATVNNGGAGGSPSCDADINNEGTEQSSCCGPGLAEEERGQSSCCRAGASNVSRQKKSTNKVSDIAPDIVSHVSRNLSLADLVSMWKLRVGIGRGKTTVTHGLYAAGNPGPDSPVLVTANYRMSFDVLRTSMPEKSFWILVLDTYGINVWCAAGKGTFGTAELVKRVRLSGLDKIVNHRTLIVPQLGAPGIKAHEVQKQTRFKVVYGPVRAADLNRFLDNGLKADENMRTITFSLKDRAVLVPVELVQSMKLLLFIIPYVLLFHLLRTGSITSAVIPEVSLYAGSLLVGAAGAPLLLPWLPGRALALKGWLLGLGYTAVFVLVPTLTFSSGTPLPLSSEVISAPLAVVTYFLLLPAVSSFLTMNFSGSTTYTSLSGVKKEMKYAVPALIVSVVVGTIVQILRIFL